MRRSSGMTTEKLDTVIPHLLTQFPNVSCTSMYRQCSVHSELVENKVDDSTSSHVAHILT